MRAWLGLSVAIVLGLAAPARADDREDARKAFAAGQAADRRRAWQEAIEHYLRAHELVPHPFAMFNIAKDYERLGKLREAATWYERYLDSTSPSDADRDKVNALLVELRNRPAQVRIASSPDGARVVINGIPTGTTPYKGQLKGGLYRVAVEKGPARDWKEITVEYGEPVEVTFALPGSSPAPYGARPTAPVRAPATGAGVISVRGEPVGALVSVDGVHAGTVPIEVPAAPGTHRVRVTAHGFAPYETAVAVAPDRTSPVQIRLGRGLGTLDKPTKIRAGYLFGGGAGADVRGAGGFYLVELGVRAFQGDVAARIGRLGELTMIDLLVRWALTDARVSPVIGGGYTWLSSGAGYTLVAGLRYDALRTDKLDMSILVESGLRYYTTTTTTTPLTEDEVSGALVPVMASLQLVYR